ncbi:MAG: L,D-transpeptidase [Candidatus Kapabacteria bacterium]|nr:L,D-transpeptidase [Candidatus Kapabacteria bacterium]
MTITTFRMYSLLCSGIMLCAVLLASCDIWQSEEEERAIAEQQEKVRYENAMRDSTARADSLLQLRKRAAESRFDSIPYRRIYVESAAALDSIKRVFSVGVSKDSAKVLAVLNRKEVRYIRVGDSLVLPSVISKDLRAYSVFPQFYSAAAGIPKIIMISNRHQAYACYEYGELVRYAACNTGTKGKPTFPGRYGVNWKQEMRISSLNEFWKLPFTVNFHQYAGNAFHQFDMPGRPVSHSCVRQFMDDAKWLFKWVKTAKLDTNKRFIPFTGTPVIILDMFEYKRKRFGPWLDIASNKQNVISLPDKPMEVEEALIPMSQVPRDARGAVPNRKRYITAYDTLVARGVIDTTFKLRESIDYNKLRAAKLAAKKKPAASAAQPPVQPPAPKPADG